MLLTSNAGVAQQFLDIEESARGAVDGVLRVAITKEGARNGDFSAVDRQTTVGVVEGQRDFGATEGRSIGRTGKDDVFHFSGTQRTCTLGTEHPRDGVHDVGLT